VICPVCHEKNVFKLTVTGYLVCNEKYLRLSDDQGQINYFQSNPKTVQSNITIPHDLILRSLPVNLEYLTLVQEHEKKEVTSTYN